MGANSLKTSSIQNLTKSLDVLSLLDISKILAESRFYFSVFPLSGYNLTNVNVILQCPIIALLKSQLCECEELGCDSRYGLGLV